MPVFRRPHIIGIFLFVNFLFVTILVIKNQFLQLDFNSMVKLQENIPDSLSSAFSMFSLLGSAEVATLILLILGAVVIRLRSIYVLGLYGLIAVVELGLKTIIDQKGPSIMFLKTHLPFQFPSSYIPHEFFSYPSGHSARTAFVSILIIVTILMTKLNSFQKKAAISIVLFFDFLMFLSRIYLGEHWLSDVIGGVLLGTSLALISLYFINKKTPLKI